MTPRTPTLPLDDKAMWRRLLARTHPDAGGSGDLFIWAGVLRDVVCNSRVITGYNPEPSDHPSRWREASTPADDKPRVPYPTVADFAEITRWALSVEGPYADVLSLLADCYPLEHLAYEQDRGASYKRLAAIAHTWGMSKEERSGWYRCAEGIPLSDRHAGHVLSKLKRQAA